MQRGKVKTGEKMKWQNGICFHARNKIGFFSRAIHKTKIIEKKLIFHETKRNFSQHLHSFHSNWNVVFHFFLLLFSLFILLSLSSFFSSLTQEKKRDISALLFPFIIEMMCFSCSAVRQWKNVAKPESIRFFCFVVSGLAAHDESYFCYSFHFFLLFAQKPSNRNQKCKFSHTHSHQSLIKWQQ